MIQTAGFRGAFFGDAADGNGRDDLDSRNRIAGTLGISSSWASVRQVHGNAVIRVDRPGNAGEGDGLITTRAGLPLAIATADCVPILIEGDISVAALHAGWRGVAAGIIRAGIDAMIGLGDTPRRAAIGPSIGPCCYEVGDEVPAAIGGYTSATSWGTLSVDLQSAVAAQLAGLQLWRSDACTYTDSRLWSYRRDSTKDRQVAVAWIPQR